MKAPEIPDDETYRLDALHSLDILDTPPDSDFDAVVALGRDLFDVPICLVSIVDADRQWFKACIGLDVLETARSVSFCGHAILSQEPLVVLDATKDERFFDNPLVTGGPEIRFYAGSPIRLPSGYQVGTVCLIDRVPRAEFGDRDVKRLQMLAELAVTAMAVRGMRGELDTARATADRLRAALHLVPTPVALADIAGKIEEANPAFGVLCRSPEIDGGDVVDLLAVSEEDWSKAADVSDGEIRTGTDGKLLRVVQDPGGSILVAKPEGKHEA
ncbi:MAG: GAF domain-containing protein [Alphaproteobacteria bacterium]|nr:GAF domain-containing protein [Alphaproteobacteria bacterium]